MNVLLQVGNKIRFRIKRDSSHTQYEGVISSISNHGIGLVALVDGKLESFNVKTEVVLTGIKRGFFEPWIMEDENLSK